MYNGAPQGAPAPEAPAFRRPSLKLAAGLYLWAVASLIGFSLFTPQIAAWLMGLFPGMGQQALSLAATTIYYLPCVLLPACLTARYAGSPEAARLGGMRPLSMLAVVGLALAGLLLVQYASVLWLILLEALNIPYASSAIALPQNTQETMLMVLSIGVLPGVCEEMLYRGAMLGAFERLGTKKAIWMTAILFTLWHGSLSGMPAELLTGLLLGYVAFAFDSVYAAITYHTVYNTALVLINVYAGRRAGDGGGGGAAGDKHLRGRGRLAGRVCAGVLHGAADLGHARLSARGGTPPPHARHPRPARREGNAAGRGEAGAGRGRADYGRHLRAGHRCAVAGRGVRGVPIWTGERRAGAFVRKKFGRGGRADE